MPIFSDFFKLLETPKFHFWQKWKKSGKKPSTFPLLGPKVEKWKVFFHFSSTFLPVLPKVEFWGLLSLSHLDNNLGVNLSENHDCGLSHFWSLHHPTAVFDQNQATMLALQDDPPLLDPRLDQSALANDDGKKKRMRKLAKQASDPQAPLVVVKRPAARLKKNEEMKEKDDEDDGQ